MVTTEQRRWNALQGEACYRVQATFWIFNTSTLECISIIYYILIYVFIDVCIFDVMNPWFSVNFVWLEYLTFRQNAKYTCQSNKGVSRLHSAPRIKHLTSHLLVCLLFKRDRKICSLWIHNHPRLVLNAKKKTFLSKHWNIHCPCPSL